MLIGYARVSTQEQETHLQTDALCSAGVVHIFEEKRSGGDMRRPVLESILVQLAPGQTLVVYKIDRIARSLRDLLHIIDPCMLASLAILNEPRAFKLTRMAGYIASEGAKFDLEIFLNQLTRFFTPDPAYSK